MGLGGNVPSRGPEARTRHRRRGVHLLDLRPPPARGDAVRGRLSRRAHLRRQSREPRRPDGAPAPVVRARRHPRPRARPRRGRRGGRDRQRRRRVARREVDRGGRVRVRDHQRRGHPDPAGRGPRHAGRAVHPDLVERGVRHRRAGADGRGAPAQPAQPLRRNQSRRRPARIQLLRHLRAADRDRPAVQQLRAPAAPREGDPALHHAGALRRAADDPRRRPREPRLALRERRRRGDRGDHRRRRRRGRRRGRERRNGRRHLRLRDRRCSARRARQARLAEDARGRAARSGRPAHRLHGEGRAAARLARADIVRRGPGAHRRVVSRE